MTSATMSAVGRPKREAMFASSLSSVCAGRFRARRRQHVVDSTSLARRIRTARTLAPR